MAGPKSTVIEYSFEGDTLNLQQAVQKVRSLLNSTAKDLRKMQGGKLTAEQEAQIKHLRKLATQMAANAKREGTLTEEQKKKTLASGKYALKEAQKLATQTKRVKKKAADDEVELKRKQQEKEAKKQKRIEDATTIAGVEAARQRASYLEEYADKFKHVLSEDAYKDIKRSVADFRAATEDTTLSQEEMAEQVEALNKKYKDYSATLQAINRSQQQAAKGILSIKDFFKEAIRQVKVAVKSFSFWLMVIRLLAKAAGQFNQMLDGLNRSGQLNKSSLSGMKSLAETWRDLSRQISLFTTNIGALISTVLAPVAKVLTFALMMVNAIVGAITGVNTLAEETSSGNGLTSLDEINTNQEQQEDQLKKMQRGWKDIKETMQPVVDLAASFGQLIRGLLSPIQLLFGILQTVWNFLSPVFDGILIGLNMIISSIEWVIGWVAKAIDWFVNLLGVTGEWTKEGTALYEVLKWIGIVLSGLVAIALTKWIVSAAVSFATLAKNIALATAKLVVYIAKQVVAIAKTIASTIANWWENASLVAKIGLLTLGAGLVIVPIVMAATGVFSNQANNVPAMAKGGVVNSPTMALIGEGKYNEAVVPLGNSPQFAEMKQDIASSVVKAVAQPQGRGQSGGTTPVVLEIDGRTLARALLPYLGYTQPQTGVRLK